MTESCLKLKSFKSKDETLVLSSKQQWNCQKKGEKLSILSGHVPIISKVLFSFKILNIMLVMTDYLHFST